jgi:hypothetical protein
MVDEEKDFAEEFFLHVVKTKQAKKVRQEEKKIKKLRKREKSRIKKKVKDTEKIEEKKLRPVVSERKITKPEIAPLPVEVPEAPTPPMKILMGPPKVPKPELSLPKPPKFFEQELKLKPIVDLGKLNNLIVDPTIEAIQCDGSFIPVKIIKNGESINTNIELNDREINDIINIFARNLGVEVKGPVFKASIQGLMLSAVVSEFAGTRFIITKK